MPVSRSWPESAPIDAWTLADGRHLLVRAVRDTDAAIARDFFRSLSPESRFARFLGDVRDVPQARVDRAVHADPARELTLVVCHDEPDGTEGVVGGVRYVADAEGVAAEFAMTIADAWQNRGIGTRLLPLLENAARQHGIERLYGLVLADNLRMLGICRRRGWTIAPSEEGAGVRAVSLEIAAAPS